MARLRTFVFWCVACCVFSGVCCISGGFYADNSLEQSILYRPLARREKEELQLEILNLLGFEKIPKPPREKKNIHSSGPKYLLDLYKAFEADPKNTTKISSRSRKTFSDSDVIVSFVNTPEKLPHLRHERNRKFFFDLKESVPMDEDIMTAELRIYRDADKHKLQDPNAVYELGLYALSEGETDSPLEPVDEVIITKQNKTGWIVFNVTAPVAYWAAMPDKNHGFYLKIRSPGSSKTSFDPQELGIFSGPKSADEKQPFMVAFFRSSSQLHVRKTRAAKKREHESYYDSSSWNPYTMQESYHPGRKSCQRLTLYVSFKDLGWENWIIAPDGYGAFYCHGECSFPLNAHMNATNHAIIQTLVHLMDPSVVSKPSCAPTQLSAITVLYFDEQSNVILKKYKNMVVKSCGCH